MSHTNSLEKLIQRQLSSLCERVQQGTVSNQVDFPYLSWELSGADMGDPLRDDDTLDVSIWYRVGPETQMEANDMADRVAESFAFANLPQEDILPTFYRFNRQNLPDEDKTIRRILLQFQIQTYERT